jgi:hypothetical protein
VTQLTSYFNPSPTAGPRTRGSVRRASGFVQIAVTLILWEQQVKRLYFVAEPRDCFNLKGDWVVMAHNLDDAGDVEQIGGRFPT